MYLSMSGGVNGVDKDDNQQIHSRNTPPVTSHTSESSSPSCSILLVMDDNSNSNDSCLDTTDIPSTLISPNAQIASSPTIPTTDTSSNDTLDKQRRRNSSIAKLLGGQPLSNQQYEAINHQIQDDQLTQILSITGDNKNDCELQGKRSSLTRTLLTNAEQNKNMIKGRPISPAFSKDFEYLIRRELDIEHAPSTLKRDSSAPSVFQNLSSLRNSPTTSPRSPSDSKLKRKRPYPKQPVPPISSTNKSSNAAPFTIRDPFELNSSAPVNSTPVRRSYPHITDLSHIDGSHRHQNQTQSSSSLPHQPYPLPVNNITSFGYPKLSLPVYAQFKMHHGRSSTTSPCSSSSCNCCRYPRTPELALSAPITALSIPMPQQQHITGTLSRKPKTIHNRSRLYDTPMERSMSTTSSQSTTSSSSSSSAPSSPSIPLKKRLLHAYKNEQCSPSSLL